MSDCDYSYDDDSYGAFAGICCSLSEGHDGPHRFAVEWDTRPFDVCLVKGHDWSDWESLPASPVPPDITDVLVGLITMFPLTPSGQLIKAATKRRECARCRRVEDDSERAPGFQVFPVLTPFTHAVRVQSFEETRYTPT